MSKLRPTLNPTTLPATQTGANAYYSIYAAVEQQKGLIHGRLHAGAGEHCAIGAYFDIHTRAVLPESLIDEVAAINDSCPSYYPSVRREFVMRWLRWRLGRFGIHVGRGRHVKHEPKAA